MARPLAEVIAEYSATIDATAWNSLVFVRTDHLARLLDAARALGEIVTRDDGSAFDEPTVVCGRWTRYLTCGAVEGSSHAADCPWLAAVATVEGGEHG